MGLGKEKMMRRIFTEHKIVTLRYENDDGEQEEYRFQVFFELSHREVV